MSQPLSLSEPPSQPRPSSPLASRLVLGGLLLIAAGPVIWALGWHELAAWRMAAAVNARLDRRMDEALRWADRAVRVQPRNVRLLSSRSVLRREAGDLRGSLEDAERIIRLAPGDQSGYLLRCLALQQAGKWKEALEDWDRIVELARSATEQAADSEAARPQATFSYAWALNGRAYARALAGVEIAEGLKDIARAIELQGEDRIDPGFLDTRGYLHLLAGNLPQAQRDMEQAVEMVESFLDVEGRKIDRQLRRIVDQRRIRRQVTELDHLLAVLLHHRGLVYEQLGLEHEATSDFRRALKLGYNPAQGVF